MGPQAAPQPFGWDPHQQAAAGRQHSLSQQQGLRAGATLWEPWPHPASGCGNSTPSSAVTRTCPPAPQGLSVLKAPPLLAVRLPRGYPSLSPAPLVRTSHSPQGHRASADHPDPTPHQGPPSSLSESDVTTQSLCSLDDLRSSARPQGLRGCRPQALTTLGQLPGHHQFWVELYRERDSLCDVVFMGIEGSSFTWGSGPHSGVLGVTLPRAPLVSLARQLQGPFSSPLEPSMWVFIKGSFTASISFPPPSLRPHRSGGAHTRSGVLQHWNKMRDPKRPCLHGSSPPQGKSCEPPTDR